MKYDTRVPVNHDPKQYCEAMAIPVNLPEQSKSLSCVIAKKGNENPNEMNVIQREDRSIVIFSYNFENHKQQKQELTKQNKL